MDYVIPYRNDFKRGDASLDAPLLVIGDDRLALLGDESVQSPLPVSSQYTQIKK